MSKATSSDEEKLRSYLLSYSFAQDDLHENLTTLQRFLRKFDDRVVDINELREKMELIKEKQERTRHEQETIAELFTQDNKIRAYRYGSAFCSKCHMFKNYSKECPYCKHLEMTI
ncbi:MAG: hypothetical protein U9R21_04100 [Candidatus Thermoplasmatota archaeon]|nr:hypothetical protein [Candidatus Thermoplasmatota archaeon]